MLRTYAKHCGWIIYFQPFHNKTRNSLALTNYWRIPYYRPSKRCLLLINYEQIESFLLLCWYSRALRLRGEGTIYLGLSAKAGSVQIKICDFTVFLFGGPALAGIHRYNCHLVSQNSGFGHSYDLTFQHFPGDNATGPPKHTLVLLHGKKTRGTQCYILPQSFIYLWAALLAFIYYACTCLLLLNAWNKPEW